ncbi:MAG TPA: methyltransferase domain-containing protein [Bryobacteraceae bacterium]|nr:methyltransferase domain-containing protein [Bryobacteraceae bacterium]
MRRIFLFTSIVLPLLAQDSVQALVEKLYPENTRLKEIRMGEVVRELGIHEGSRVADVGCGGGEFSVILSHVVGARGRVYCEDIVDEKDWGLSHAKRNLKKQHVKNAAVIRGADDDPKLPPGSLDAVLIVNAYHEMPKYQAMLRHIRESLKPGGRLAILDNMPHRTGQRPREKQTDNHVLSPDLAAAELEAAGFHILDRQDGFIDNPDSESSHWLIAAESR